MRLYHSRKKTPCHGFTLVELLAVSALIVMFSGTAGVFYLTTYQKRVIEKSARQLLLTARYGRIVAIERHSPCRMVLDKSGKQFYLAVDDPGDDASTAEERVIKNPFSRPVKLHEKVNFQTILIETLSQEDPETSYNDESTENADGQNTRTIIFAPDGTTDNTIITLTDGKRYYTLKISGATGKTNLIRGQADQVEPDTLDLDEAL
ncbi:MAG: prepilin-type N-terminal cleavage/methylation domain-containing protein [Phycisphaerae bacterium]|nr:prepilin-type N-terminal cleavage/methylation domain-containing protein [Phycisphaerae bacterium]